MENKIVINDLIFELSDGCDYYFCDKGLVYLELYKFTEGYVINAYTNKLECVFVDKDPSTALFKTLKRIQENIECSLELAKRNIEDYKRTLNKANQLLKNFE